MGVDRVSYIRLGPLHLWLARADKEWGYATEHGELTQLIDLSTVPSDVVPRKLTWATTVFDKAPMDYELRPALPDRPLVVRPVHAVRIPRGQSGTFYALIPCFLEIVIHGDGNEYVMGKVPSQVMSDTWFGDHARGDLCYSLPASAQRDRTALDANPHHIICPVEVNNTSKEELFFEKFCIRPRYLSVYSSERNLWSSKIRVLHEGSYNNSSVRYETSAPEYESGLVEVAKAAEKPDKRLQWLTFGAGFQGDLITTR